MDKKIYYPLLNIEKVLPILNKIAIFGGLSEKHLCSVFRKLESVEYEKGEEIFHQGDEPSYIYIIREGEVRLVVDIDVEPLEISDFYPGDCFGETGVIGILPHSATAVAMQKTDLIVLHTDTLHAIFETDKELFGLLMLNIARETCRRLHKSSDVFLHYVHNKKHR